MSADSVVLVLLVIVIAAILLYPVWRRYQCGTCPTTTTVGTTTCFPSTTFPVKSGLIDLRNCNDEVYILGDQSRVHFLQETP